MEERRKEIDITEIVSKVWKRKRLFVFTLPIAFVLACLIILPVPRYYTCEVKLAPESQDNSAKGGLSSITSSLGLNFGKSLLSGDAISPELYPDLMESKDFSVSLFNINVRSKDGKINTTYYDYLDKKQKSAWWEYVISLVKNIFKKNEGNGNNANAKVNSFMLTKRQTEVIEMMQDNIICSIDKKTDVITISTKAQDPLACAIIADSVRMKLQTFITNYRTNKARLDLEYTKKLYAKAKQEYIKAQKVYAAYCDANNDIVLKSFEAKRDELENEMQLKYNIYDNLSTQLQLAYAKVQEQTPAFTKLQGASVPVKPAGPKRMIFVMVVLIVAFLGTSVYILTKRDNA